MWLIGNDVQCDDLSLGTGVTTVNDLHASVLCGAMELHELT